MHTTKHTNVVLVMFRCCLVCFDFTRILQCYITGTVVENTFCHYCYKILYDLLFALKYIKYISGIIVKLY